MRPKFLAGCLWALWSCGFVCAQTTRSLSDQEPTAQRPSSLRDAGVITRATPPESLSGTAAGPNQPAQPSAQSPTNFPVPASSLPHSNQAAAGQNPSGFSDRAWVGSSSTAQMATNSQVVPAQFVSANDPAKPSAAQTQTQAPAQAAGNGRELRPLKPPSRAEKNTDSQGSTSTVQMFVSVFSSLAIVIGLILAAAWFYRQAAPKISGALPKQVVQVLGRTPLAPRQQLVLLRLGHKLVLVSNLHGEVRTISEITDPLEVDRLAGLCEAAQPGSISESFRSVLHNMGRNG